MRGPLLQVGERGECARGGADGWSREMCESGYCT